MILQFSRLVALLQGPSLIYHKIKKTKKKLECYFKRILSKKIDLQENMINPINILMFIHVDLFIGVCLYTHTHTQGTSGGVIVSKVD